ncbi:MAG: metalloregulator ArsR/SmtB family transcription factor [Candidatus Zixiibacteriota bacterium]
MSRINATDFSIVPGPLLELVADCFQALSDPTRLRILRELRDGDKTVQQLVGLFSWTQANISRHLSVLSKAGLVRKTKKGSFVYYGVANRDILSLCDLVCSHVNSTLKGLIDSQPRTPKKFSRRLKP